MKNSITVLSFLVFLSLNMLYTQNEVFYEEGHRIESYTEKEGIVRTEINSLLIDAQGYLWLVNSDHLLRYDGYKFQKYNQDANVNLSSTASLLWQSIEDHQGNIWLSSFADEIYRFNKESKQFEILSQALEDKSVVTNFVRDNRNNILVGGKRGLKLLKIEKDTFHLKSFTLPVFPKTVQSLIDSISNQKNLSISTINQVGPYQNITTSFELNQTTRIIIICLAESWAGLSDYGWLEDEKHQTVWSFSLAKSTNAGGGDRNRIIVDTLTLTPGTYHLRYSSNDSHDFTFWDQSPPATPEWWGIKILNSELLSESDFQTILTSRKSEFVGYDSDVSPFTDQQGNPYILSNEGIARLNYNTDSTITLTKIKSLPESFQYAIPRTNKSGETWIPRIGKDYTKKIFKYNPENNILQIVNHGIEETNTQYSIMSCLQEDSFGNLWVGTRGEGLYKLSSPFTVHGDSIIPSSTKKINLETNKFASSDYRFIRNITLDDKTNTLWVGTRRNYLYKIGLSESAIKNVDFYKQTTLKEGLVFESIFEDNQKGIWINTKNKLIHYNLLSKASTIYTSQSGYKGLELPLYPLINEDNSILFGSNNKLIYFNNTSKKSQHIPLTINNQSVDDVAYRGVKDGQNKIWLLTQKGGVVLYHPNKKFFSEVVQIPLDNKLDLRRYNIFKDNSKGIWLVVNGGYGPVVHLAYNAGKIDTLQKFTIGISTRTIQQDSKGNIWGASMNGLTFWDAKKDTLIRYSQVEGLENTITDLIIDKNEKIWVHTSNSIVQFDPITKRFIPFRQLQGYRAFPISKETGMIQNQAGYIHALTDKGFISFLPDSIKKSQILPTIIIENININDDEFISNKQISELKGNLSLSHSQNNVSIYYKGISFDDAEMQIYKCQLEGINANWVDAKGEHVARFPNLPSGKYTFKVKATNADGIWSEAKSLPFTITPPWWKTWWAYTLYALATLGSIFWYFQNLNKKLQKEQAHNKELADLNIELTDINTANQRFVPNDFLQILGKQSIKDLHLGDQTQTQMTILFSDIRSYTTLSEKMTPQQNFNFINAYLGRVGPIIKQHGGFISQYMGDGFMALFVENSANAIQASIAMQKELQVYNQERMAANKVPLKTGIGLNTGDLMLGVIGDEHRYESTVISDAVNTASRMEGLTKVFGGSIILSEKTLVGLLDDGKSSSKLNGDIEKSRDDGKSSSETNFAYRYLGKVKVKGKDKALKIYDLYEGEPVSIRELKAQTKPLFEEGITYYFNRQFGKAAECFKQVLAIHETDIAAQYYLDKSVEYILKDVAEDWSGVEEMVMK